MPPDRYDVPNWVYELLDNGFITRNSGEGVPFNFSVGEPEIYRATHINETQGRESLRRASDILKEWSLFDTYHPLDINDCIGVIAENENEYRKNNKIVSFEEMMGGIKE